jgi:hypothetical protein
LRGGEFFDPSAECRTQNLDHTRFGEKDPTRERRERLVAYKNITGPSSSRAGKPHLLCEMVFLNT